MHAMVSLDAQVAAQVGRSVVRSAQQVPVEHGTVGHVLAPASVEPPLLDPLLLPELLPEPLPELPPLLLVDPPPLELVDPELPIDASPAPPSVPAPTPALLPEHPAQVAVHTTRPAAVSPNNARDRIALSLPRARHGNMHVTVYPALLAVHVQPACPTARHWQEAPFVQVIGYFVHL